MIKYKISFKRCYLYLRIFIKPIKRSTEQKKSLVFDKVVPSVAKNYEFAGNVIVDLYIAQWL